MKIKYRITILFTLLVTFILFFVCASIYYFSDLNRKQDFQRRIRNRALSTISLLVKVEGIDILFLESNMPSNDERNIIMVFYGIIWEFKEIVNRLWVAIS